MHRHGHCPAGGGHEIECLVGSRPHRLQRRFTPAQPRSRIPFPPADAPISAQGDPGRLVRGDRAGDTDVFDLATLLQAEQLRPAPLTELFLDRQQFIDDRLAHPARRTQ